MYPYTILYPYNSRGKMTTHLTPSLGSMKRVQECKRFNTSTLNLDLGSLCLQPRKIIN